jgi:hypothetical protein
VNVPPSVIRAAREGLILIISRDEFNFVHKWRSKLTDDGFLLEAEDGLQFMLPILDGEPWMLDAHLIPALRAYFARVILEIARGDEIASSFFAARLTSRLNENPLEPVRWFDGEKIQDQFMYIIRTHPDRFTPGNQLRAADMLPRLRVVAS